MKVAPPDTADINEQLIRELQSSCPSTYIDLRTKHATCGVRRRETLCEVNRMASHTSETFTAYTDALKHSEKFPCREANGGVQV